MKHWGSALFPLIILATLTALTFWLRSATEMPDIRRDGKHRHDPDFIVDQANLRKVNANGHLQYTLKSIEMRHFPDDETSELKQPDVVFLNPKRPSLNITSDHALVSKDGEQIDLTGNVRIVRAATASDPQMVTTTTTLTVFPDDETAFTKSPVLITQGKSWIKGIGMQLDNRALTAQLESRASAVLESKHAKKP